MKRMKCGLAMLLAAVLVSTLVVGCGSSGSKSDSSSAQNSGEKTETEAFSNDSTYDSQVEVDTERLSTLDSDEVYDEIVLAIGQDPQDLNPWNVNAGGKKYTYLYFYESLFDFDAEHYYPVLAKGYTEVDDLHWDVEIYDYIYDSAGNHITADDVVYSYKTEIDSGYVNKCDMLEDVEALDDYTVRFTWNKPIDGVCELEWVFGYVEIFSQEAYENGNFATEPVATGPYVVKSFTAGSGMILERNENYWQEEDLIAKGHHANVQTINVKLISEYAQQVIGLQDGTIDFSYAVPSENLPEFMEGGEYSDRYHVYRAPTNGYYYLEGNMGGDSIWSDKNFRLAVFYALNNDVISAVSDMPAAAAACTPLWNEYYEPWSEQETYINTYDPELAKEYLDASSYNGETVLFLYENEEDYENIATVVMSLLNQIGIDVKIQVMEQTQLEAVVTSNSGGYDMFLLAGGGSSLVGGLNRILNNADYSNGCAPGMLNDETLFEKYTFVNNVDNCNLENMTDFMDYVLDNAYLYVPVYQVNNFVYTRDIAELGLGYNYEFILGECEYYLD